MNKLISKSYLFSLSLLIFLLSITNIHAESSLKDTLVLELKWHHQFQFAGYYAAIEKGYYKAAGLNIKLIESTPNTNVYENVSEGKAQFGIGNTSILIERENGRPLVVLGSIFQHSPSIILVDRSSGILTPRQLINKRIMFGINTDVEIMAMLRVAGVDRTQMHEQPYSGNPKDLITGQTDAQVVYSTNEPYLLKNSGGDPYMLNPLNYGIDFYGDCIFTNEMMTVKYPDKVEAFWKASLQGWQYAMDHPEELADIIIKKYSKRKQKQDLLAEARSMKELIQSDLVEIGHSNPGRWKRIADLYIKQGLIKSDKPLQGLIFTPTRNENMAGLLRWVATATVIFMLILIVLGVYNKQLVKAVDRKTSIIAANEKILLRQNEELIATNENIQRINKELIASKEKAEESEKLKSAILANMSHEIRTPMNGIVGFSDLLLQSNQSPEKREQYIKIINTGCHQLLNIINDIVDISKIEAGQARFELSEVDMRNVVQELMDIHISDSQLYNISIHLIPDLNPTNKILISDKNWIIRILNKLISNALKFTDSGYITLGYLYKDDHVEIFVSDTGIGIAPEHQQLIFKPFWQVYQPNASKYGGTGLGLSIAKSLTEILQGKIWVTSEPNKGSSFYVRLPYNISETV